MKVSETHAHGGNRTRTGEAWRVGEGVELGLDSAVQEGEGEACIWIAPFLSCPRNRWRRKTSY